MTKQGKQDLGTKKQKQYSSPSSVANVKPFARVILFAAAIVLALSVASQGKELPDAPSAVVEPSSFVAESTIPVPVNAHRSVDANPIDAKFLGLALISTGSTFADSYTTLFARENWLARKQGVCNAEVQSAYLYGTHPTVGREYTAASIKSVGSVAASYYMRKHHSRFWSMPLLANSVISLQGVTQNMIACN